MLHFSSSRWWGFFWKIFNVGCYGKFVGKLGLALLSRSLWEGMLDNAGLGTHHLVESRKMVFL